MQYAEVEDGSVVRTYNSLPTNYRNISNLFALDVEMLGDLGWSGNPGVGFYEYIEQRPDPMPEGHVLSGPSYSIDQQNKKVFGLFTSVELPPVQPQVPETITATQIRLWLVENEVSLAGVNQAIESIEDHKTREITKVQWEYAPYVERSHPLIETIGMMLGMDSNQIDQAFIEASQM